MYNSSQQATQNESERESEMKEEREREREKEAKEEGEIFTSPSYRPLFEALLFHLLRRPVRNISPPAPHRELDW